jgi:predicted RNA-binding protein YlxR (DUF448 family)
MVVKKVPIRTCVVTREQFPKNELIRVIRTPEGEVTVDTKGKANGRGAYLKKDKTVILKAQKTKVLDKILEVNVPDEIYERLLELI